MGSASHILQRYWGGVFRMLTRYAILGTVCLAAVLGFSWWWGGQFRALEYDGVRVFSVGKHRVSIATKSLATGDNGAAELTIDCHNAQTSLPSSFNADLYSDVRPAYVSWEDIDDDWYKDLVIWRPSSLGGVETSGFISSIDGQLHVMKDQRQHPLPSGFGSW